MVDGAGRGASGCPAEQRFRPPGVAGRAGLPRAARLGAAARATGCSRSGAGCAGPACGCCSSVFRSGPAGGTRVRPARGGAGPTHPAGPRLRAAARHGAGTRLVHSARGASGPDVRRPGSHGRAGTGFWCSGAARPADGGSRPVRGGTWRAVVAAVPDLTGCAAARLRHRSSGQLDSDWAAPGLLGECWSLVGTRQLGGALRQAARPAEQSFRAAAAASRSCRAARSCRAVRVVFRTLCAAGVTGSSSGFSGVSGAGRRQAGVGTSRAEPRLGAVGRRPGLPRAAGRRIGPDATADGAGTGSALGSVGVRSRPIGPVAGTGSRCSVGGGAAWPCPAGFGAARSGDAGRFAQVRGRCSSPGGRKAARPQLRQAGAGPRTAAVRRAGIASGGFAPTASASAGNSRRAGCWSAPVRPAGR